MAAITAAVVGGAVAAGVGSSISAKSNEKIAARASAAAAFNPFAINTGNVSAGQSVDAEGNKIEGSFTSELTAPLESAQDQLNAGVLGGTIGGPGQGLDRGFQSDRFDLGTRAAGAGAQGLVGGIEGQNRLLQDQQGQLGQATQQFQGAADFATQTAAGTAGTAARLGEGFLGQNFGDVRQQELDLLRQQARPGEDRAVNAKFQNLFSRGQLGSTGGANQIEALASAQENADVNRQLAATQTAQGLRSQNLAAGQGLLGLGQQGAGLVGNLASQRLGGATQGLGAQASAGQQRLANTQSLFGFGQDLRGLGLQESKENLGISTALSGEERANLNLSGTFGGAAATAGGNQASALLAGASGSPVGSALGAIGTGLIQQGISNIGQQQSTPELQQITLPDSAVRRG
jgi:hypothetical protein